MRDGFILTLLALFAALLLLGDAVHDMRWAWRAIGWDLIITAVSFWVGYWWERRKQKRRDR
jgi:uncharacterized membrane protein YdjX (TVP38/TMEM64 family)